MIFATMLGAKNTSRSMKKGESIASELAQSEAKVTAWKVFVNR